LVYSIVVLTDDILPATIANNNGGKWHTTRSGVYQDQSSTICREKVRLHHPRGTHYSLHPSSVRRGDQDWYLGSGHFLRILLHEPQESSCWEFRGGRESADAVDAVRTAEQDFRCLIGDRDIGKLKIVQKGPSLALAARKVAWIRNLIRRIKTRAKKRGNDHVQ
jgi:hypothetical protein